MRALLSVLMAVLAALACPRAAIAASAVAAAAVAAAPAGPVLVIADFDALPPACFPAGWKSREGESAAERVYRVASENGAQFLHAVADGESVQIGLPVSFTLREYPLLSWRWRVVELPAGADEREAATNDSAAGVYVVFKGSFGGLLPRVLKYVWSAHEPRGSVFPSPRYANAQIVVLESGSGGAGNWQTEVVDMAEDYRRVFRAEPPELQGIALLTDADDTGSRAVADYDDFRALAPSVAGAVTDFRAPAPAVAAAAPSHVHIGTQGP